MSAHAATATHLPQTGLRMRVYLQPGQLFASAEPCEITTILGSCVGVVLVDVFRRIGGACHYLLAFDGGGAGSSARFGNVAIKRLISDMCAVGSRKHDLQAKVFGGACMRSERRLERLTLGDRNVEVARTVLAQEGLPIVAEDVGGCAGRKLVILTDLAQVWVKKL